MIDEVEVVAWRLIKVSLPVGISHLCQVRGDGRVLADNVEMLRRGQTEAGNDEIGQKPACRSWLKPVRKQAVRKSYLDSKNWTNKLCRPYSLGMAKIYTKTGDSGQTGLLGGKRVPKNHVRVEAYGTVDEANALLGVILAGPDNFPHRSELEQVQGMLFEIGAVLADPLARHHRPNDDDVAHLEQLIDVLTLRLLPQTSFILPGGTPLAATLHFLRTIVRRAERRVVTVSQGEDVPPAVARYLNRLSDYLHTLARYCNTRAGVADIPWHSLEK